MEKDNLIQKKSFDFTLSIIGLYKVLVKNNEWVISKQLLRSATSIEPMLRRALLAKAAKILSIKCPLHRKKPEKPGIGLSFSMGAS